MKLYENTEKEHQGALKVCNCLILLTQNYSDHEAAEAGLNTRSQQASDWSQCMKCCHIWSKENWSHDLAARDAIYVR